MRDDTDPTTKKATKPGFDDGNCKFYYALITKAKKSEKNAHGKTSRGQRKFAGENATMSPQRGLVVNFERAAYRAQGLLNDEKLRGLMVKGADFHR